MSAHPFSLLPAPTTLQWSGCGEAKVGLLGNVSISWGSRVLIPLSLSPLGESQAEKLSLGIELCCLWGRVARVKLNCFFLSSSMHLFMGFYFYFLLKEVLDSCFPTEVFPCMDDCQNWCFYGEYEGWNLLFCYLADVTHPVPHQNYIILSFQKNPLNKQWNQRWVRLPNTLVLLGFLVPRESRGEEAVALPSNCRKAT